MSEYPCLPPITDHAFMRLIRKRCEDMSKSMAEIAEELGCDVDDLCRWVMAYKAPKKHTSRDTTKYGPPIEAGGFPVRSHAAMARGFEEWRRAKEGAAATRRMLEKAS